MQINRRSLWSAIGVLVAMILLAVSYGLDTDPNTQPNIEAIVRAAGELIGLIAASAGVLSPPLFSKSQK